MRRCDKTREGFLTLPSIDFVFWPASARIHGFRGHVEAAKAGGFTALAIAPETYLDALESGLTPSDMKAMAADAGAPLRYLDSLTDWAPIRVPAECSPELRARFDVSTDHSFRMCEKLGLTSILAVAGYDKGTVELPRLVDGFGRLCERAHAQGYWIDLEFMPFWGMPNLSDAWAIVSGVNPPRRASLSMYGTSPRAPMSSICSSACQESIWPACRSMTACGGRWGNRSSTIRSTTGIFREKASLTSWRS
ncbi:TIM barrel protein [Mesorhizobium sp.]|uniref:TIM barrel protein n=1 Tax=Mesorhizobium sp. TaxID=1871066 RepID=UPI002579BAE2|nr:TIM barrel protein [Mesorhizobium sp.]